MSSNIIIKNLEATRETHEYLTLSKECGFFTVEAETRICYSQTRIFPELHYEEVWDTELHLFIDGKQVNYKGFKELYEKLYGENSFDKFCDGLIEEFENTACLYHRKIYKTIEGLDKIESNYYVNKIIEGDLVKTKTHICEKTNKKYLYSSDYILKKLCENTDQYAMRRLKVPYTYSPNNNKPKEHLVVVLHEYLNK